MIESTAVVPRVASPGFADSFSRENLRENFPGNWGLRGWGLYRGRGGVSDLLFFEDCRFCVGLEGSDLFYSEKLSM